MKKQLNSVSSWSVKGIISITILSAMLGTFSANANNKPSLALNSSGVEISENRIESISEAIEKYNAAEFVQADMALEIESRTMRSEEIFNVALEAEQYHAGQFVKADMANEIDSWKNSNDEYSDLVIQSKYQASEFVQADLDLEIESWMNSNGF
ncbi:MAG: hypothetical protein GZ094_12325 [Mariniphaga sp.]|nr:hypothetical protein [Mariniphaga sp.]